MPKKPKVNPKKKKVIHTVQKSVEKVPKKRGPKKRDPMVVFLPKLERWLILGYTLTDACTMSGVPNQTVFDYYRDFPKFRDAIDTLRNSVGTKARANILNSIQKGNIDDSWKWLERKHRDEFATRQENTGKDGEPLTQPIEVLFTRKEKK